MADKYNVATSPLSFLNTPLIGTADLPATKEYMCIDLVGGLELAVVMFQPEISVFNFPEYYQFSVHDVNLPVQSSACLIR
jgi:hypothetical protein